MARNFAFAGTQAVRDAAENAVFGRLLTQDDYGDIIGDITKDATGTVKFNRFSAGLAKNVAVLIRAQTRLFNTTIRLDPSKFYYSDIRVHAPRQGTGVAVLRLLAATAAQFDFPRIDAVGEKRVSANPALNEVGYYVYPKLGFDAAIPAKILPKLAPAFAGMTRISQLIATPAGDAEWEAIGDTVEDLVFDLAPGSASWNVLNSRP